MNNKLNHILLLIPIVGILMVWHLLTVKILAQTSISGPISGPISSPISSPITPTPTTVPQPTSTPTPSPTPSLSNSIDANFDLSDNNFTASGFWHPTTRRSASTSRSFWYGQDSTGNYNNGLTNSGFLTTPQIQVNSDIYQVSFSSFFITEDSGMYYDKKTVELSVNGGPWGQIYQIAGTPNTWTTHSTNFTAPKGSTIQLRFKFNTVDSLYNNYEGWFIDNVKVAPAPQSSLIYSASFNNSNDNFTLTGLWNHTSRRAASPSQSFWYGNPSTGNYNNGTTNAGTLTSPSITLSSAKSHRLTFKSFYITEDTGIYWDKKTVEMSVNNGPWSQIYQVTGSQGTWLTHTAQINAGSGSTIKLRFNFNTVDSIANNFEGWYIDDVQVVSQ